MLRLLARRGFTKADWITPSEFAASIPQAELAAPVGRLTEIYQAARFGDVAVEPRQSVELLREIRERITALKPLQSVLTALNPPMQRPSYPPVLRLVFQRDMTKSAILPKVGFVSLGCPKNLVDSEVMMGILAREGYELTPRADDAEVLIVNTCSFIESAQKESVDAILEMAEYKKFGSAKKIIVAGCLVERYRNDILAQIPEVDAVVGTGEVEKILDAVRGTPSTGDAHAAPSDFLYHELTPRMLATPRHAAYIKIAEGCDHPCSFCIIPQLRGKFRSRRFESVVREAENLARAGVSEITLIGQDTTSYGEDLNLRDGLAVLLSRLAQIPELAWVRFLYAYPNRVTQGLLDALAAHPRLVKYLDMPLQHASRNVLASMKRGSNGDAFLKLLERVRKTIPGVSLRTSFIVGFPGETAADFRELRDFVRAAEFDWMGVFTYSDVDTAGSFALGKKVDENVKAGAPRRIDGAAEEDFGAQAEDARRPQRDCAARRCGRGKRNVVAGAVGRHGAGYRRQSLRERHNVVGRRSFS